MNFEKLTEKSIESINHAQELSRDRRNPEITEMHLLHAPLDERDDLNFQLFTSMGKDAQAMLADIDAEIAKLPTLGNGEAGKYMTSDLGSALSQAEEEAKRMGDSYVSVEHLMLGLIEKPDTSIKALFKKYGISRNDYLSALKAVRGNTRVNSDNPESTYDVLTKYGQDLTELARQQKLDPVIGRDNEIRSVIRILSRKTKNNPCLIGEPGVGKTAFGMFCATSSASNGRTVCVASAEMTDTQMGTRLMADASGVNANRLRKAKYIQPEDWQAMSGALTRWGEMPISFLFARELETITAQVRSQHDRGQCEMLLVDYAQLLTTRKRFRDGDFMRIGYISKEIKRLAVDLRIPVILLAQVGRQEKNSLPTLSELKGSGSLEEDADNVIFLHRIDQQGDEALPEDMREPWRRATLNGAKVLALSIAKQRQGETGKVFAAFDSAHMRYTPLKP